MATLKLKKPATPAHPAAPARAPVRGRGSGLQKRPTLGEAQTRRQRDERSGNRDELHGQRAERSERGATPQPRATPAQARQQRPPSGPPQRPSVRPPAQLSNPPPPHRPPQPPARPSGSPRPERQTQHLPATAGADPSLRLSKRMSQLGIASRREADEWIARGWVRVDGRVVSELGSRVLPDQHVTVDAKARSQQAERVTVLLNKPVGFVSGQAEDGYQPAVVLVTAENQWRADHSGRRFLREHLRSLVPAGRLDIDSTGLLVLTQDGRIAKQLIGESTDVDKEYLVRVAVPPSRRREDVDIDLLRHGLELDGEALRPALVEWVNQDQLRFVLRQGKKRQIRRMCEAVGLQVLGLKRVRIGSVMLGDLPPGQWRYLRADEAFASAVPVVSVSPAAAPAHDTTSAPESMQVDAAAEQAEQADDDQVQRNDEVQQPRHDQDQDAGDQGDQRTDAQA